MNPADVRVVFMGSPAFAVPSLRALVETGYGVSAVVTQPDKPAGRGGKLTPPDVKVAAHERGVPTLQPRRMRDEAFQAEVRALRPHLLVVAAYGKILPQVVLDIPTRGCVNVHASLLPRWRGASPISAAILAGDEETGVSIMEMALKMDAGPVISVAREPLHPTDTTGSLGPRLAELGARLLINTLADWYDGQKAAVPQDESLVTTCGLVAKSAGHLSAAMTATEAERAVRAYNPWPGAYAEYRGDRLGIWRAHLDVAGTGRTGDMVTHGKLPAVTFTDGLLVLDEVQRPGKGKVSGQQFLAGERGQLAPTVGLA